MQNGGFISEYRIFSTSNANVLQVSTPDLVSDIATLRLASLLRLLSFGLGLDMWLFVTLYLERSVVKVRGD